MGTWNHRILVEDYQGEMYFQIHEVYYDENNIPNGYAENPANLCSESVEGLNWALDVMKEALNKPILWGGDKFPQEYKNEKYDKKKQTTKMD